MQREHRGKGQVTPEALGTASEVMLLEINMEVFRKMKEHETAWCEYLVTDSIKMVADTSGQILGQTIRKSFYSTSFDLQ